MKDTYYFSHDYNARADQKIKKLLAKHGLYGYGVYWAIVEDLYNNANALPLDYESIAYDLRCESDIIISVINDFSLFVINGNIFSSDSVERRLLERKNKSLNASKSANKRWEKEKVNANALQTHSECNAIKERKEKEKKEKCEETHTQNLSKNEIENKSQNNPNNPVGLFESQNNPNLKIQNDIRQDPFIINRAEYEKILTQTNNEGYANMIKHILGDNLNKKPYRQLISLDIFTVGEYEVLYRRLKALGKDSKYFTDMLFKMNEYKNLKQRSINGIFDSWLLNEKVKTV